MRIRVQQNVGEERGNEKESRRKARETERKREREREREKREAESQVIKLGNKPIDMPVGLQPPLAAEASP